MQLVATGADAAGAGKYVTIWGTYTGGGDLVTAETILVNGATAVDSSASNWQKILGVNANWAPAGLITIQKKTGAALITSFATSAGAGVQAVTADEQAGGDMVLDILPSLTSTKQIGILGTDLNNAVLWDSQALNATATVQSNSQFRTFTTILTGDLEATTTVTVSSHVYPAGYNDPYLVWWSGTDDPEGYGTEVYAPQIIGSSNQPLLDGIGKITGVVDGGDCFFVFKTGAIYRFDGPPFQPTVIESTKGMSVGNLPYRQGSKVYFWAESGLHAIDIKSNDVVNVCEDFTQRALTDESADAYGGLENVFPRSKQSTIQTCNNLCTGATATIAGDVVNSLVWVQFYNGSNALGYTDSVYSGLIFHEKTGAFTHITSPIDSLGNNANRPTTKLVNYRTDSGTEVNGIGSYIRCVFVADIAGPTDIINVYGMNRVGFATTDTRDVYLRWPFWGGEAGSPKSRILRVRPLFDNSAQHWNGAEFLIKAEVISLSGTQKTWRNMGTYSIGEGTSSKDGWVTVDGCPFADSHSIGISILGTSTPNRPRPYLVNFVGLEVDYATGPSKSI